MFCPYCGAPLDDDALNCTACNSPVEPLEKSAEPAADTQPKTDIEQSTPAKQDIPALPEEEAPVVRTRSPLLRILLTAFGILATLAAVVALAIYLLPILAGKGPATGLYVKDNELYTTRLSKILSWQVTDQLIDTSKTTEDGYDEDTYARLLADYTYLTKDGRTLFYPDKYIPGDEGITIYYRNIKNPEEEPQKLDSNIYQYTVSPDGSRGVYLKSDGTLFRFNSQGKEKVATGISPSYSIPHFYTSEDCKNLIYMLYSEKGTFTVYAQSEGGERRKLASDCTNITYINDACTVLYYTDSDSDLYKVTASQDKTKIAYNVSKVFWIYESGEIYYATNKGDAPTITPGLFVEDDVKTDASRNPIRQALADATGFEIQYASAICYYDGDKSHTLAENCLLNMGSESIPYSISADTPTLIYSYFEVDNVEKVKFSQVANYEALTWKVTENIRKAHKIFMAYKGTATQIETEKGITAADIRITNDGKTAYYLAMDNDGKKGDLYKFAIADGKAQKAELYAPDVYRFNVLDNRTVLYYTDYSESKETADLYVNEYLVDYDILIGAYHYDTENKWLLYITDMDKERTCGTLKIWEDGNSNKIADDVWAIQCVDDEILYLTDYDEKKGHGTLYLFQNDNSQEVDTDVSYIIDSNDSFGFVFRKTVYTY